MMPAQADHRRLAAEGLEVGADEAVRDRRAGGKSTSAASGMPRLWISRISRRPSRSGIEIAISRSNRPGRRKRWVEGVGQVGRRDDDHVLALASPSIRARSCATTRFSTSPTTFSRCGAMASISSRKMMLGAWRVASSKILRRWASLSP